MSRIDVQSPARELVLFARDAPRKEGGGGHRQRHAGFEGRSALELRVIARRTDRTSG